MKGRRAEEWVFWTCSSQVRLQPPGTLGNIPERQTGKGSQFTERNCGSEREGDLLEITQSTGCRASGKVRLADCQADGLPTPSAIEILSLAPCYLYGGLTSPSFPLPRTRDQNLGKNLDPNSGAKGHI